jgi:hypothetical protein
VSGDGTGDRTGDWRAQRNRAIQTHAAHAARQLAAETAAARALVGRFAAAAQERGVRAVPLVARGYSGHGRYRTGLHGWYLRHDGAIAVGTDGKFYALSVPGSVRGRLTGVTVPPTEPRLVVGEGARDGERISLADLLELRLAAGDDWPVAR